MATLKGVNKTVNKLSIFHTRENRWELLTGSITVLRTFKTENFSWAIIIHQPEGELRGRKRIVCLG